MKRFLSPLVLSLALAFSSPASAAGPVYGVTTGYYLPAKSYTTVHIDHPLGYIPQVQVLTGNSVIEPHVFIATDGDIWIGLHNIMEPPSMIQEGTVEIYLY